MIFSDKIYKITSGENVSLYADENDRMNLYIFNKSLKNYQISTILNRNCVFCKDYNYSKIIQINTNTICVASNGYITLLNKNDI